MVKGLHICLLGEQELTLNGARLSLPPSKKTRALLGYLVLSERAQRRERLCELLWDVADDPRAALRWSLSKLRELVDGDGERRLKADREHVRLELATATVDVLEAKRLAAGELAQLPTPQLERALSLFRGELLEGLDMPDFHAYHAFCRAEREALRGLHTRILRELMAREAAWSESALARARKLVELEPTSESARAAFMQLLNKSGRAREAELESQKSERLFASRTAQAQASVAEVAATPPRKSELPQPFVGRSQELERLCAFVHAPVATKVLVLSGEPGIGKSRLLARLAQHARARGGSLFSGAAHEADPGFPYAPWSELLAASGLPLSQRESAAIVGAPPVEPFLRAATRSLAQLFEHASAPRVLLFEELHWFDEASTLLFSHVIRASRSPLAIVVTARSGELLDNGPVRRLLRALRGEGALEELTLGPLTSDESAELVRFVTSGVDAGLVHAESGGNPLFTLELARAPARVAGGVPPSITRVVRERMEAIAPELVDVLRWAAVLGADFRLDLLEQLLALEPEPFVEQLEQLERLGWLSFDQARPQQASFSHELVRRAVYDGLSAPRRRLMHARVARQLAARSEHEAGAAELAHHALLGGDAESAVRACLAAGLRCLRLSAIADADALARRGLEHVRSLPARESCLLELELHELALLARKPEQVEPLATRLHELAREALSRNELEHARRGFFLQAFLLWEQGEIGGAQRFSHEAERCSRLGGPRERLRALAEAARCLALLERDLTDAEAFLLEAEALVAAGEAEIACVGLARGTLALSRGELPQAEQALRRARELAEGDRDRLTEYFALETLLELLLCAGRLPEAEQVARALQASGERSREGSEACFARAALALVRAELGQEVGVPFEQALVALRAADAKQRLAYVLVRAGEYALQRGEPERARAWAAEALPLAAAVERPSELVLARVVLVEAAMRLGAAEEAERERAELASLLESERALSFRARQAGERAAQVLPPVPKRRKSRGAAWNS